MELGAVSAPEFFLFLPQMRFGIDDIVERAVAAESSGFRGISFMDHLAPPLAESSPMYEAVTLATWVAARTSDLIVSHLVLCDAFRHPAVLARQAVTLDHASGGRFELGLGSGERLLIHHRLYRGTLIAENEDNCGRKRESQHKSGN